MRPQITPLWTANQSFVLFLKPKEKCQHFSPVFPSPWQKVAETRALEAARFPCHAAHHPEVPASLWCDFYGCENSPVPTWLCLPDHHLWPDCMHRERHKAMPFTSTSLKQHKPPPPAMPITAQDLFWSTTTPHFTTRDRSHAQTAQDLF